MREQVRMLDEHIETRNREHAEEENDAKQFEAAEAARTYPWIATMAMAQTGGDSLSDENQ